MLSDRREQPEQGLAFDFVWKWLFQAGGEVKRVEGDGLFGGPPGLQLLTGRMKFGGRGPRAVPSATMGEAFGLSARTCTKQNCLPGGEFDFNLITVDKASFHWISSNFARLAQW